MKARDFLAVFNRGLISRRALARVDVDRVALSAEEQTNWMPRVLGSMSLRVGTSYEGNFKSDAQGVYVGFVFAADDVALLEMTPSVMRVWDDGDSLVTRPSVSASVTNGGFDSDLTGWTDADETGATSTWATGGYMQLLGTKYLEARRRQSISISEQNTAHGLRVVIERGPVLIRIGTSAGADDVFSQAVLRTGTHSLAFTPGANPIHIELASALDYPVLVDSVSFEASGTLELPTPWSTVADLELLREDQIGDLIFLACDGFRQRRIERRVNNSWSIVTYEPNDGPFVGPNTDGTRLTPSGLKGEITLTASRSLFDSTDVGRLYRLTSQGQKVEANISAEATFSDSIRISAVGDARDIEVVRAGTWSATISLQRSIGEEGSWVTVATYTTNGTVTYNDGLDNTIAFYRIGIETGNYTSGTAELSLTATVGSITGVVKVTAHSSATSVTAVVLSALGGTDPTEIWEPGSWCDTLGYPTAVAEYEGRLWWAGRGRVWGSVSDAFTSFDPDFEGDSGPINRSIGSGAVDDINWLLPLQRLIGGSGTAEHSLRSTSFDEPLTPTNFNIKAASTQGSAKVPAARYDGKGVYLQRSKTRLYELGYDIEKNDYGSLDLLALVPELGETSQFRRIAVQRQPDTRVWCLRDDGTAAVLVRDRAEDVLAWIEVETDGAIEDIAVLPGMIEDSVYWSVKRTIDGATVRFHEKMALEKQCRGGSDSRLADAHVVYSSPGSATLTGLDHLEGETVVVWADGADAGTKTVSGGSITLASAPTNACVGLTYRARYKSAKLAAQTDLGIHLGQVSRIDHIGLILADTHAQGLKYGPDFNTMDELPLIERGDDIDQTSVWESYDNDMIEFKGDWSVDNRVCLEANAPRPATVMALLLNHDRQQKAVGTRR